MELGDSYGPKRQSPLMGCSTAEFSWLQHRHWQLFCPFVTKSEKQFCSASPLTSGHSELLLRCPSFYPLITTGIWVARGNVLCTLVEMIPFPSKLFKDERHYNTLFFCRCSMSSGHCTGHLNNQHKWCALAGVFNSSLALLCYSSATALVIVDKDHCVNWRLLLPWAPSLCATLTCKWANTVYINYISTPDSFFASNSLTSTSCTAWL